MRALNCMSRDKISIVPIGLMFSLFLSGGSLMSREVQQQASGAHYFSSPEAAVPIIADLLRQEDFKTLTQYYDFSGSEVERGKLKSGDFFIRRKRPEIAHPAGFWRYKHPFSPSFSYSYMSSAGPANSGGRKGVHIIHLSIEIDQGAGSPPEVGLDSFLMIESDKGWQVLPGHVEEEGLSDELLMDIEPAPEPLWKK